MLLRSDINNAVTEAKKWFLKEEKKGKNSMIFKSAKNSLRSEDFVIWYDEAIYKLDHLEFYYDEVNQYWAETDGIKIWLNTYMNWNHELLKNTLIHEALHYVIQRQGRHELSEEKEHNIMFQINPKLINYNV